MEQPLVVAVDGSAPSLLAVDWAVDEVARLGLPLRLVHAFVPDESDQGATARTGDAHPPCTSGSRRRTSSPRRRSGPVDATPM
jgi:nucleotide-binding universal stress UspA family protein